MPVLAGAALFVPVSYRHLPTVILYDVPGAAPPRHRPVSGSINFASQRPPPPPSCARRIHYERSGGRQEARTQPQLEAEYPAPITPDSPTQRKAAAGATAAQVTHSTRHAVSLERCVQRGGNCAFWQERVQKLAPPRAAVSSRRCKMGWPGLRFGVYEDGLLVRGHRPGDGSSARCDAAIRTIESTLRFSSYQGHASRFFAWPDGSPRRDKLYKAVNLPPLNELWAKAGKLLFGKPAQYRCR